MRDSTSKMDYKGLESKQGDPSEAPAEVQARDSGELDYVMAVEMGEGCGSMWKAEVIRMTPRPSLF